MTTTDIDDDYDLYTKVGLFKIATQRGVSVNAKMTKRQVHEVLREHLNPGGPESTTTQEKPAQTQPTKRSRQRIKLRGPKGSASSDEPTGSLGSGGPVTSAVATEEKTKKQKEKKGDSVRHKDRGLVGRTMGTPLAIIEFGRVPAALSCMLFLTAVFLDAAGWFPFDIDVATKAPAVTLIIVFLCLVKFVLQETVYSCLGPNLKRIIDHFPVKGFHPSRVQDDVVRGHGDTSTCPVSTGTPHAVNTSTSIGSDLPDADLKLLTYADADKRLLLEENIMLKVKQDDFLMTLGTLERDLSSISAAKAITEEDVTTLREDKQKLHEENEALRDQNRSLEQGNATLQTHKQTLETENATLSAECGSLRDGTEYLRESLRVSEQKSRLLEEKNNSLECDLRQLAKRHFLSITLQIISRIRPAADSIKAGELADITVTGGNTVNIPSSRFRYDNTPVKDQFTASWDHAFGPGATNADVFHNIEPWIEVHLTGQRICIMTIGQSGTGKSHTLFNQADSVVILASKKLFERLPYAHPGGFEVTCSAVEIYLDNSRDLLGEHVAVDTGTRRSSALKTFPSLAALSAGSAESVADLVRKACSNRKVDKTLRNASSSRGHMIFLIRSTSASKDFDTQMCFIDLAGNEAGPNKDDSGVRVKETQFIHESLSSVQHFLLNPEAFAPGRTGLLTAFLKQHVHPSKMVLMPHISPYQHDLEKSLTIAKFADKVADAYKLRK
ncbi:hypothetical protein KCU81_g1790, partial [Aureobasidium melanogenum]